MVSYAPYVVSYTYEEGIAAKDSKDYAKMEKIFEQLHNKSKENSGYLFFLGLAQRYQGKNDKALLSQQKVLEAEPNNMDAKVELARLYYWKKNYYMAEQLANEAYQQMPDYENLAELKESIEQAQKAPFSGESSKKHKWQIDAVYEHSRFKRQIQPNWRQYTMRLGYWVGDNTLVHFKPENYDRRNRDNQYYETGVLHFFNDDFNARFSLGYTSDPTFMPKWRTKIGADYRLTKGWGYLGETWFDLRVQHDRYRNLETTLIKPSLHYYIIETLSLQATHINVLDEDKKHLKGWSTRLNWAIPDAELRLFVGLADAPETENGATIDTKARFGGLSFDVTPTVTLRASYAREDRENSYIRHVYAGGVSFKF